MPATKQGDYSGLADLLFGAYRRDALALLLLHPGESFHVREIARITGRPANTLYRELNVLAQAGLLRRRPLGNQVHYSANPDCPIYEELRGILRKTIGVADVLRDALSALSAKIETAFVHGSVAAGTERALSDIDLVIVGEVKFQDVVSALAPASATLRREINPKVYRPADFRKRLREREPFLKRVMTGPKLRVLGVVNELG